MTFNVFALENELADGGAAEISYVWKASEVDNDQRFELTASNERNPGDIKFFKGSMTVPPFISAQKGIKNNGNEGAKIIIDETTVCDYKAAEKYYFWIFDIRYIFESCSDGSAIGDLISVNRGIQLELIADEVDHLAISAKAAIEFLPEAGSNKVGLWAPKLDASAKQILRFNGDYWQAQDYVEDGKDFGQLLMWNGFNWIAVNPTFFTDSNRVVYIKDIKRAGISGGSCSAEKLNQRDLNNLSGDTSFVTLVDNILSIEAGRYQIEIMAPGYLVAQHQIKLVNVSTGEDLLYGSTSFSHPQYGSVSLSTIIGELNLNHQVDMAIFHHCTQSKEDIGLGIAIGQNFEVYTQVKIIKITK